MFLMGVMHMTDLSKLPRKRLETMAAAGEEVVECMRVLAKTGDNVVSEVLRDQGTYYELEHYPDGDIVDPETHSQYFYHAHRPGEHGHFHTFLKPQAIPAKCKPAPLPDRKTPEEEPHTFCHLVGISMDKHGVPIRIFTTNLWLTEDTWYNARDVCAMLDLFEIDVAHPSWPANRWISAMFRLFRPQMIEVLQQRDAKMAALAKKHPKKDIYAERKYDILTMVEISIDEQIEAVFSAIEGRGGKSRGNKPARRRGTPKALGPALA